MAKIDERVWALHVWRSPDGNEHPQWSGPDDLRLCRCGERHALADAPARLICPGVAHYEGVRPCVLCGLGWRIPATISVAVASEEPVWHNANGNWLRQAGPAITRAGVIRPAPLCVYCMTLEGKPLELARHRTQAHRREGH